MTAATRVLVVDDHAAVRRGISAMLAAQAGIVVDAVASAGEAHERWLSTEQPPADIVLVDRHLPDEDGLSLCLWLATRAPAPAVVIASPFADETLALPAVVAGAAAIVAKSADPAELCAVVRMVAAGERWLPGLSAAVAEAQGARLASDDLPILGMLRHGVAPAAISETLGTDEAGLTARRWAMLEALTAAAERRDESRLLPRPHTIRALSPSTATTSPGWS